MDDIQHTLLHHVAPHGSATVNKKKHKLEKKGKQTRREKRLVS